MKFNTLISTEELTALIKSDAPVIIDCRFSLAAPNWGQQEYKKGHIPGAQYAHLDHDLSGIIVAGTTGRHPFPDIDTISQLFSKWGIHSQSQVVVYDQSHGGIAARLWYLLQWLGHQQVAVLNGGWEQWVKTDGAIEREVVRPEAGKFVAKAQTAWLADIAEVISSSHGQGDWQLVDSRAAERYSGKNEPIDPIAGHIPTALSFPFLENLGKDGLFLPKEQLKERFQPLVAQHGEENLIFYCGSGVTACHNILTMHHLGYKKVRLYPGSWSEWITDPSRGIATISQ